MSSNSDLALQMASRLTMQTPNSCQWKGGNVTWNIWTGDLKSNSFQYFVSPHTHFLTLPPFHCHNVDSMGLNHCLITPPRGSIFTGVSLFVCLFISKITWLGYERSILKFLQYSDWLKVICFCENRFIGYLTTQIPKILKIPSSHHWQDLKNMSHSVLHPIVEI